eukprot:COSAG04_NODE_291_length_17813_cov_32.336231_22_plen_108_part_00
MNCEEKKIIAQLDVTDMNDMNCSTVSHVPCPQTTIVAAQICATCNQGRHTAQGNCGTLDYHSAHLGEHPVQGGECPALTMSSAPSGIGRWKDLPTCTTNHNTQFIIV